jgi:hypothetical protein
VTQLYPQALGTHFSRLLRHAWATVGLFFNTGHHTVSDPFIRINSETACKRMAGRNHWKGDQPVAKKTRVYVTVKVNNWLL